MTAGPTTAHPAVTHSAAGTDPQFSAEAEAMARAEPDLDFTPLGILSLDVLLAARWDEAAAAPSGAPSGTPWRPSPEQGREIARFGIWLGEALRRTLGGVWERAPEAPEDLLRVRLLIPDGPPVTPVGLLCRRAQEGRRARIWPIYQYLRRRAGVPLDPFGADFLARGRHHLDQGHAARALPYLEEALYAAASSAAASPRAAAGPAAAASNSGSAPPQAADQTAVDPAECALCLDQA
jgi:hypothetical protein